MTVRPPGRRKVAAENESGCGSSNAGEIGAFDKLIRRVDLDVEVRGRSRMAIWAWGCSRSSALVPLSAVHTAACSLGVTAVRQAGEGVDQ
jgi:hypothetical protein